MKGWRITATSERNGGSEMMNQWHDYLIDEFGDESWTNSLEAICVSENGELCFVMLSSYTSICECGQHVLKHPVHVQPHRALPLAQFRPLIEACDFELDVQVFVVTTYCK